MNNEQRQWQIAAAARKTKEINISSGCVRQIAINIARKLHSLLDAGL